MGALCYDVAMQPIGNIVYLLLVVIVVLVLLKVLLQIA